MSFTERPKPGTRVHVEYDGTVHESQNLADDYFWQVVVDDGDFLHVQNWTSDIVSKISEPVDENWPPQAGDVWRHVEFGMEYHALRNSGSNVRWHHPENGYGFPIDASASDNWELVYRPESA